MDVDPRKGLSKQTENVFDFHFLSIQFFLSSKVKRNVGTKFWPLYMLEYKNKGHEMRKRQGNVL